MDGIVYLLNQSGLALAEANRQIEELRNHIETLTAKKGNTDGKV